MQAHDIHTETVSKILGALGVNTLALITSYQEQAEWWLRIGSLVVAITYTSILIFRALRKPR